MTSHGLLRGGLALIAGLLMVSAAAAAPGLTAGEADMRAGPGPNYPFVMRIPDSAAVDVQSCTRIWCRVSWRYRSGYIRAASLDARGPGYGAPVYGAPPVYVEPGPVVVAPFWGPGWGYGWHGGGYRRW